MKNPLIYWALLILTTFLVVLGSETAVTAQTKNNIPKTYVGIGLSNLSFTSDNQLLDSMGGTGINIDASFRLSDHFSLEFLVPLLLPIPLDPTLTFFVPVQLWMEDGQGGDVIGVNWMAGVRFDFLAPRTEAITPWVGFYYSGMLLYEGFSEDSDNLNHPFSSYKADGFALAAGLDYYLRDWNRWQVFLRYHDLSGDLEFDTLAANDVEIKEDAQALEIVILFSIKH